MSELKSYDLVDIQDYRGEVYIKSEADKEIALLTDKANYNEFAYKRKSEELADSCRFYEDELSHNKYKRCLAMAMCCRLKRVDAADYRIPIKKWEFYEKWRQRWMELAEQFKDKEAK